MKRKVLIAKLLLGTALLMGAWFLLSRQPQLKGFVNAGIELLRGAGPIIFFSCMALLPAMGAPLSFFCLTVGPVFGPQLGMPVVILLSVLAIAVNIAVSHLLARRALRPPLEYLVKRLGYQLPQVASGNVTDLIVLLRVTPGLPFPVQNYLLGLAGAPFLRYFVISCLIAFPLNVAIVVFGEALLQGRGKMALVGLLLVLAGIVGVHMVRRRYRARTQPTAA